MGCKKSKVNENSVQKKNTTPIKESETNTKNDNIIKNSEDESFHQPVIEKRNTIKVNEVINEAETQIGDISFFVCIVKKTEIYRKKYKYKLYLDLKNTLIDINKIIFYDFEENENVNIMLFDNGKELTYNDDINEEFKNTVIYILIYFKDFYYKSVQKNLSKEKKNNLIYETNLMFLIDLSYSDKDLKIFFDSFSEVEFNCPLKIQNNSFNSLELFNEIVNYEKIKQSVNSSNDINKEPWLNSNFSKLVEMENSLKKLFDKFILTCNSIILQIMQDQNIAIVKFSDPIGKIYKIYKKVVQFTRYFIEKSLAVKIATPFSTIIKNSENFVFICITILPITKEQLLVGTEHNGLLVNASGLENENLQEIIEEMGNIFKFKEENFLEKYTGLKKRMVIPLQSQIFSNNTKNGKWPNYSLLGTHFFSISNPDFVNTIIRPELYSSEIREILELSSEFFIENYKLINDLLNSSFVELLKNKFLSKNTIIRQNIEIISEKLVELHEDKEILRKYFTNDSLNNSQSSFHVKSYEETYSKDFSEYINTVYLKIFADFFSNLKYKITNFPFSGLKNLFHFVGLNMFYLGKITEIVIETSSHKLNLQNILITEIVSRSLKNILFSNFQFANKNPYVFFEEKIDEFINILLNRKNKNSDVSQIFEKCQDSFNFPKNEQVLRDFDLDVDIIRKRTLQIIKKKLFEIDSEKNVEKKDESFMQNEDEQEIVEKVIQKNYLQNLVMKDCRPCRFSLKIICEFLFKCKEAKMKRSSIEEKISELYKNCDVSKQLGFW